MNIAIVPISAKPFHAGHDFIISAAQQLVGTNGLVIIPVSTTQRGGKGQQLITTNQMEQIWDGPLKDYISRKYNAIILLPTDTGHNSPVKTLHDILESLSNGTVPPYLDINLDDINNITIVGGSDRGSQYNSIAAKFSPELNINTEIINRDEDKEAVSASSDTVPVSAVSGTVARKTLACRNVMLFKQMMPGDMSNNEKTQIYQILCPVVATNEHRLLKQFIFEYLEI